MMLLKLFLKPIETFFNQYLQLDPETKSRLQKINGKVILVEVPQLGGQLFWEIREEKMLLSTKHVQQPDVTLQGMPLDFMRVSCADDQKAALQNIKILGDAEVAQQYNAVFADLDIDWEEQMSKVTGDIVAHRVCKVMREMQAWAKQVQKTFQSNVTEYVQEEAAWSPSRAELEDFYKDVDVLRDDVERLTARVNILCSLDATKRNPG